MLNYKKWCKATVNPTLILSKEFFIKEVNLTGLEEVGGQGGHLLKYVEKTKDRVNSFFFDLQLGSHIVLTHPNSSSF